MPTQIERKVLLVDENGTVVVFFAGFGQFGQGVVGTLDVGRVVLAVVKFVDLPRNVRFQRPVVIVQVGQCVFGDEIPFRVETSNGCIFRRL